MENESLLMESLSSPNTTCRVVTTELRIKWPKPSAKGRRKSSHRQGEGQREAHEYNVMTSSALDRCGLFLRTGPEDDSSNSEGLDRQKGGEARVWR